MSLTNAFKKAGSAMFTAFGDVIKGCTHKSVTGFNPVTEVATTVDQAGIRVAVKPAPRKKDNGEQAAKLSAEIVILQDEITLTPKTDDTIVIGSKEYVVRGVNDVSGIVFKLTVSELT